jgi:tRNA threonylcarbamoyladenosine biosynthesis protein TsaE
MNIFEKLLAGIECDSAQHTRAVGSALARALPEDATLALHGDLGTGKTTFVSGLAAAWDIPGPVTSPTYTYYLIHQGERQLIHLDAYRLGLESDAESLGLEDFLKSPWCLVVEWPSKVGRWLPADAIHIEFDILAPGRHTLRMRPSETPRP